MPTKTKRRAVVTCSAIKKNGERCRQTRGLVNGLCSSHRTVVEEPVNVLVICRYQWTNGRKCEEVAVKDGFCHLHRPDNFDTAPVESNADLTIPEGLKDLVDEIENFVPEKDVIDADSVVSDVLKKAEELAQEEERPVQDALNAFKEEGTLVALNTGYTFEEAAAILEQYKPLWEPYVPMDSIEDIREFAVLLMDVVKMHPDELTKEFMAVTVRINELSEEVNMLFRDAKYEYGDIPLDIRLDIDSLNKEILQLKGWKGLLLGTIEFNNKAMDDKDSKKDMDGDKPSKFAGFARFFKKGTKSIFLIGLLAALLLLLFVGQKKFNEAPKENVPPVVVDNGPTNVDKGTEPTVPATPGDVIADAPDVPIVDDKPVIDDTPVVDGTVIVPVPVDTYIVQDGDTLWDIAVKVYGDGSQWTKIYDANHNLINGDDVRNFNDPGHWIHAGQVFNIPGQGGDI
jgi:LysM repeat protein